MCDKCTLTLLDDLEQMDDNLNKDATHVLDFEVHAPWPKLEVIEKDLNELNDRYNDFYYSKNKIINFNETIFDKLDSRARHLHTRVNKLFNKAEKRKQDATNLITEGSKLRMDTKDIVSEIDGKFFLKFVFFRSSHIVTSLHTNCKSHAKNKKLVHKKASNICKQAVQCTSPYCTRLESKL